MIIGINGRVGSGKDTVGRIIQYLIRGQQNDGFLANVQLQNLLDSTLEDPFNSQWPIKKFATKLKKVASIMTGIPVDKFEDQEFKKTTLGHEWSIGDLKTIAIGMTVRHFLQKLGTDAIRNNIHTNAWVNALMADYKVLGYRIERTLMDGTKEYDYPVFPNWIVTDCRFPNEAEVIKGTGGPVIRVTRPGENLADLHPSETSLDDWKFDYIIHNDGGKEDLVEKVQEFLQSIKLYNGTSAN